MDTLTSQFNQQANILMYPLWTLLLLDICERRIARRQERIEALDRHFHAQALTRSQQRYAQQNGAPRP